MADTVPALLRPPARTAAAFTAPAGLDGRPVVLAVNAGSSSLKFGLYVAPDAPAVWSGQFEGMEPGGQPRWKAAGRSARLEVHADGPWPAALALLADALAAAGVRLAAVAHRIVHGGEAFTDPVLLDGARIAALAALAPLAPLHQPHNLAGVRAFAARWPEVAQIGCFDTAFHASLPPLERRLPLPPELVASGMQRYGFHGLSYDHLVRRLTRSGARIGGRALLAHLGNGASLCATVAGRSVATSMGFSALDGLMMGTRCGSLDAGVVLHLWRQGWSPADVEDLLYRRSGLLGVSGLSADLRVLRASDDPRAQLAIDLFAHRARREAGALLALLGGVDLLAFTGGIGEHDAAMRAAIAEVLAVHGLRLDPVRNAAARGDAVAPIHADDSAVEAWVVPCDEGRIAATAAFDWLQPTDHRPAP